MIINFKGIRVNTSIVKKNEINMYVIVSKVLVSNVDTLAMYVSSNSFLIWIFTRWKVHYSRFLLQREESIAMEHSKRNNKNKRIQKNGKFFLKISLSQLLCRN